jgi:ribosome maturation factor RimP
LTSVHQDPKLQAAFDHLQPVLASKLTDLGLEIVFLSLRKGANGHTRKILVVIDKLWNPAEDETKDPDLSSLKTITETKSEDQSALEAENQAPEKAGRKNKGGSQKKSAAGFKEQKPKKSPGSGVTIDDCTTVSHLINDLLSDYCQQEDIDYEMEVSSPGLDRPLYHERDYIRFSGCRVKIKLNLGDKNSTHTGMLMVNPLRILTNHGEIAFDYSMVLSARLVPVF